MENKLAAQLLALLSNKNNCFLRMLEGTIFLLLIAYILRSLYSLCYNGRRVAFICSSHKCLLSAECRTGLKNKMRLVDEETGTLDRKSENGSLLARILIFSQCFHSNTQIV